MDGTFVDEFHGKAGAGLRREGVPAVDGEKPVLQKTADDAAVRDDNGVLVRRDQGRERAQRAPRDLVAALAAGADIRLDVAGDPGLVASVLQSS